MERIMIVVATVTTLDIRHVLLLYCIMLKHSVLYHIFYCSVNHNYRQLHSATATE